MKLDRIIKGGNVVTPAGTFTGDIGIAGETIAALAVDLEAGPGTQVIDATGHHVLPGVLDVHVHLALPFCGTVSADDYRTGTRAGARGGVTTVIDFAIPYAGESLGQAADNWMKKAEGKALIDYTFHICITRWNEHQSQIKGMVDRGFTTFKEFMIYESEGWQSDDRALFGTLEQMREHGTMLLVHAESARVLDELIARHHTPELMARYGARLHPMTRPNFVEAEAIQRVVQWCEATGGQLYIVHMSTAEGSDIVRAAQARGVPVLAETCAQYLVLDDSVFEREDGHLFACCPQIKKPKDVERLWKGLRGGEVSVRLDRHLHLHPRAEGDVERGLDQDPHGASRPRDPAAAGLHPRRARRAAHAGGAEHEAQHQPGADHGPLLRERARSWWAPTPTWRSSILPRRAPSPPRRWRPTPTGRRTRAGSWRALPGRPSPAER